MKRARVSSSLPLRSTYTWSDAVDHDLGDPRVVEERLERAVAQDVVGDLPLEVARSPALSGLLLGASSSVTLSRTRRSSSSAAVEVQEGATQPGDARPVDLRLQLSVRIAGAGHWTVVRSTP